MSTDDKIKAVITKWDALNTEREAVQGLLEDATMNPTSYYAADERSTDLREIEADLGAEAIAVLREVYSPDDLIRRAALYFLHSEDPRDFDLGLLADALGEDRADVEALAETPLSFVIEIDNHYEEIKPVLTRATFTAPAPPAPDDEDEWVEEYITPRTGTGWATGDSWYFVKITGCTDPVHIGRTFEIGT